MTEGFSLVPLPTRDLELFCAWPASQPVIPIDVFARAMGVKKRAIEVLRWRHPEIKIEPKVLHNLCSTFGRLVTEFGEITFTLETPGGPQDMICFTMYGAFLHALQMRTVQARRFVRAFPLLIEGILLGKLRPPSSIAARYRYILGAPRRHLAARVAYVAAEMGVTTKTIWEHLCKIRRGQIDRFGLPAKIKPGPPKGYISRRMCPTGAPSL